MAEGGPGGRTMPRSALDPQTCLLGDTTNIHARLRKAHKKFLLLALCVARKCIAITWKSVSELSIGRWDSEMNSCVPPEKLHIQSGTFMILLHRCCTKFYLAYMDTLSAPMVDGL